jgi:hypothetical protein
MLAHVAVNLEERYVTESWPRDFDYVGAIFAEDASDGRPCDDPTEFEYFDTF